MARYKKTPTPEEQIIVAQLYDWGHWRRLQTLGVGYKNHNNDSVDHCTNEDVSEHVNQAYNALKDNHETRARIIKSFYVDRRTLKTISGSEGLTLTEVRNHKLIAEGWIDRAVNY